MERVFSVEDIAKMWHLGSGVGFPRTDSEAAFQDFLKRIPSTSNLAAQAQGLDHAQQLQLQQQVQQFQQTQQAGLHAAGAAGALGEVGSLNVGGIPRVPSLDLLRQLVQVNQTMSPQAHRGATLAEAGHAKSEPELGIPVTEGLSVAATMPLAMSGLPQTSALPVIPAAAPMHVAVPGSSMRHTMQGTGGNTSDATAGSDRETNSKAEIRRARRMLSNRESARRSRRRKQEHLGQLEEEISKLTEEKRGLADRIEELERQLRKREDENARLRRENDSLRDDGGGHKQENGRKLQRSSSLQRVASNEHTPKKACHRGQRADVAMKPEIEAS